MIIDFGQRPPQHVTEYGFASDSPAWWYFRFPNGHGANVALSDTPFRFDVETDDDTATGLTSEQVEAKLTEVAALPQLVEAGR